MKVPSADETTTNTPLRVWPGVVIVALQWLAWLVVPAVIPEAAMYGVLGGVAGGLAVILWWLFFSRALWLDRLAALALMVVAVVATRPLLHPSIATGGMGMLFYLYVIPVLSLAFVVWAVVTQGLSQPLRRATMVATILVACGAWTLFRTYGFTGAGDSDFAWRWEETPEERFVAQAALEQDRPPLPTTAVVVEAEWGGFRGPHRDGVVHGSRIVSDWAQSPPSELWRRQVGPGWSSFAVAGDLVYTQEQRGEEEVVSCYDIRTGEVVWLHGDATRFWESNAGAGPRATPTLSDGRLYAFGATGILNALDAADGSVVWSRNAATDTERDIPTWGFASSPLVVSDSVIVAVEGQLAAYDLSSGEPRWFGPSEGWGYSSPHTAIVEGVSQVLLLNGAGAIGVTPEDGSLLWQHRWPGDGIVQPALTPDGDLLIGSGSGMGGGVGIRRLEITMSDEGWSTLERWTTQGLKPYFNDFVVHEGHAFGFDGSLLAAVDLASGERRWKGGRYGSGQLILLADQDLLLVLSERGELALISASPTEFSELARVRAIEGKTWNHPVLVDDLLLVRNGVEMAAFRLATRSTI